MRSQSIAGFLGAVVAAVVLAAAFYYVPVGPLAKPSKVVVPVQAAPSPDAVPATPAARGPVVKDVPN
jgi:hypothetical protein